MTVLDPSVDTHSGRAAERRLRRALLRAVDGFGLIEKGDRVLVALSGGKDSFSLLELLLWLQRRRGGFGLEAVYVDHGFGNDLTESIGRFAADRGVPFRTEKTAIARVLGEKLGAGQNPCPLCARLRRGTLYRISGTRGFSSIALGHQADDLIETLWLNLLFTGQLKSMPPKLLSDDGRHTVMRPLALAWEEDTRLYAAWKGFPVGHSRCPARDGQIDSQRRVVKQLILNLESERPGGKKSLLRALSRLDAGSLLDTSLLGSCPAPDLTTTAGRKNNVRGERHGNRQDKSAAG